MQHYSVESTIWTSESFIVFVNDKHSARLDRPIFFRKTWRKIFYNFSFFRFIEKLQNMHAYLYVVLQAYYESYYGVAK